MTPSAQADLDDIWDYSAERWGEQRAESYVREIWEVVAAVAADYRRGRACDDVRPGYWRCSAGRHVLFYRLRAARVEIVRILHQSMDFERHL